MTHADVELTTISSLLRLHGEQDDQSSMVSMLLGTGPTLHEQPMCILQRSQPYAKERLHLFILPAAPAANAHRPGHVPCLIAALAPKRLSSPEVAHAAMELVHMQCGPTIADHSTCICFHWVPVHGAEKQPKQ